MISNLSALAQSIEGASSAAVFEGRWHAIEFQPELDVPQFFVIGVALTRRGKLVVYRVAEEAARLKCFYGDQFTPATWGWLRTELLKELKAAADSAFNAYVSASPQVRISSGHYVSGSDAHSTLARVFDRIVTVTGSDKKPRVQGVGQSELRQQVTQMLKQRFSTRFEQFGLPEGGLSIQDKNTFHTFDVGYDDHKVASTVVSACYVHTATAQLNVFKALNDLRAFQRIRDREQIGLAVLLPTASLIPSTSVREWTQWWEDQAYKLGKSDQILLAQSESPEALADMVGDWYD